VPVQGGFLYRVAVMDWFSRFVLSWEISNSLTFDCCLRALQTTSGQFASRRIFNSDQGSPFTGTQFMSALQTLGGQIKWDGKGRATDHACIERLWRSVKWEGVYLNPVEDGRQLYQQLTGYFHYYNYRRPHQGIDGQTPASIYLVPPKNTNSTIQ
jgi:putative transposase